MEAYFDNSATTKVLDCVKDAVVDAMCVNYGNAAAKHRKGVEAENLIREAKKAIADTLKVQEKENQLLIWFLQVITLLQRMEQLLPSQINLPTALLMVKLIWTRLLLKEQE